MITATTWVPRGFAAPFPEKYQFDEDEYERISQLAKLQLDDAKEDLEEAQAEKKGTGSSKAKSKDHECVFLTPVTCPTADPPQRRRRRPQGVRPRAL